VSVHGDGFSKELTLADWLLEKYPGLEKVGESMFAQDGGEIKKPGLVHRLDKETSGLLLIAKDQETFLFLKKQFQEHTLQKTYRLIVAKEISLPKGVREGKIDLPIGRSKKDPRQRLAGGEASGVLRPATTYYQVLKNYSGFAYVEAHPKTGRTHQLRVHFKAVGHPIICDSLYSPQVGCLPGLARLALHSYSLEFAHPDGRRMTLKAPLPADFQSALENLESLC
jgi:23S rRNA pseudouridine1911/1915/1917 synthase